MSGEASSAPSVDASVADEAQPQFGKYQLLRLLARGGMGEVYLARLVGELGFEKQLVVKTILPELAAKPRFIEMFAAEAKTAVALSHGNIVPTYELGRWGDIFYIVMGYVDGPSLSQILARCRKEGLEPNRPAALHIIRGVLAGLAYAHRDERGRPAVVHRDVSPRNILIDRSGQVRIVDFGIAARAREQVEMRAGSQGYMAPEQARAEAADPRADVFSTACLLYELVTFRKAFPTDGVWAMPDFDDLPDTLMEPLRSALSLDPDDRPADAAAFVQRLRPALVEHAITFGDPELAAWVSEVFPGGWELGTRPATAGKTSIQELDAENETFATRLTAVTNVQAALADASGGPADGSGSMTDRPAASGSTQAGAARAGASMQGLSTQGQALSRTRRWGSALLWAGIGGAALFAFTRWWQPEPDSDRDSPGTMAHAPPPAISPPSDAQQSPSEDESPPSKPQPSIEPAAIAPTDDEASEPAATKPEPDEWVHRFRVDPPDATVEVDGRVLGGGSPYRVELPERGSLELTIRKDGFRTRTVKLSRQGDLPARLALAQDRPKGEGALKVLAPSVAWAEVRVDGRKVGTTPTRKLTIGEGKHHLEVRCVPDVCPSQRILLEKTIVITPGEIERITVE